MKPPAEFKILRVRECGPCEAVMGDHPDLIAKYWREQIATAPWFNQDQEAFVSIMLNTRMRILGHTLAALGTVDQVICHSRDIFRAAIVNGAYAIALVHNHPSGDPAPSGADIKISRQVQEAGSIIGIRVVDSIIIGSGEQRYSLRENGLLDGRLM